MHARLRRRKGQRPTEGSARGRAVRTNWLASSQSNDPHTLSAKCGARRARTAAATASRTESPSCSCDSAEASRGLQPRPRRCERAIIGQPDAGSALRRAQACKVADLDLARDREHCRSRSLGRGCGAARPPTWQWGRRGSVDARTRAQACVSAG